MSAPPSLQLLNGVPRSLLGLLVASAVAVAGLMPFAELGPVPALLGLGAVTALHVVLAAVLTWRARRVPSERAVWGRLALGAVVLAVAVVGTGVLSLLPATRELAAAPVAWAPLLAFPFWYGGLVRWNRFSTSLADPNDVLNGIAAVLAVVAVGNVVIEHTGGQLAALPWWQLQALLAQTGAGFVLVGTMASIAFIGQMARDPRTWLVTAAFGSVLAAAGGALASGGDRPAWAAVLGPVTVVLLALAAPLRPARTAPQPADPSASTIGAFVVIVFSIGVLALEAADLGTPVATWCAALATLASGVRMLVNVRELAQLAVSRREALTDELTGLANRRAVLRRIEELCEARSPITLALLDLDKFKEVNDGLGHAAGDDLLRFVARRLEPVLRPGDLLGRLGGDEFAVVATMDPDTSIDEAARSLGRRLHDRLCEPFPVGGLLVHASVSIGLTTELPDGEERAGSPTRLLRRADAAMYEAKRSDAEVVVYDATRHADSSGHLALVEDLRAGLATGQLLLHHQPQVDVATGRTVGVESLVRWAHPVRGLLGPGEFLPLAEVHALMGPITEQVLGLAITQAAAWHRTGRELRVSVNLSASNLLDARLPVRVAELLDRESVPASALVLEVTESVLLSDPERSLAVVGALAELGVTVAIDDFGTGYSSLAYLRELPVAELKLDRSFTDDLLTNPRTEVIVASTIALAHQLGMRVVAEGVEQADTFRRLEALGCDISQGFLHARPLPAEELAGWLDRQDAALTV